MGNGSDDFTFQQDEGNSSAKKDINSPAIQTGYDFEMDEVPDDIKGSDSSNLVYLIPILSVLILIGGIIATVYLLMSSVSAGGAPFPLHPVEFVSWAIDTLSGIIISKLEATLSP